MPLQGLSQWYATCPNYPPLPCLHPQDAMQREYAHLQRWVEWCGQSAVEALVNLERRVPGLAVSTLRDLRSLQTPDAARKVLSSWLAETVTRSHIESACKAAALEQYVDWCWIPENEYIHPAKGAPHSSDPPSD